MKHVVSISLGSSTRNHRVETKIFNEDFIIERIGTDGDMDKAIRLFDELDGKVDAFGLGGIDLYIYTPGGKRYAFRDAQKLVRAVKKTPFVDGSGLKNTLERKVIKYLKEEKNMDFAGKPVLMVSAVDRFGMAQALAEEKSNIVFGDLIFGLGLPIPLKSLKTLDRTARIVAPLIVKLPFKLLYPTGNKQEKVNPRFAKYYYDAEIIAGDFHFIRRYMPEILTGKTIITNTVTARDIELLKKRGVKRLVTTTPELNGRSFGTNVMEGVLVALAGKRPDELTPEDYLELLEKIDFKPRVEEFN